VGWTADGDISVFVGDDFWSVEYRLPLGSAEIPVPQPGVLWGFNLVRVYRGADGNNTHQPDEFGLLLFE
jgi:hypothetical protein